jgi:N-acetylneuraminate synthase/N,N'-diacetyllegionaminate synthase
MAHNLDGAKFMERIKSGPAFIIAEAGVNHNGDITLAHKLVDAACDAGADSVKFQSFNPGGVATSRAETASYQQETTGFSTQTDLLRGLVLSPDAHRELLAHCNERGILFLSTPHDWASIDFLDALGILAFKIGSGDLTNLPFLTVVAAKQHPVILSSGMATLDEVQEAVAAVTATGNRQLALLHCVTNYPAAIEDSNLLAMHTIAQAFGFPVGYSDHTSGIEVASAAVALGARIIEKHFTLDSSLSGPDHRASTEPGQFKVMVENIRRIESALGTGEKVPTPREAPMRAVIRKSIVATQSVPRGTVLSAELLTTKRPGIGIEPRHWDSVIGRQVKVDIPEDTLIHWEDLE